MDRDQVLQEVLKILKPYEGRSASKGPLSESTQLAADLDIDSARMVDIVLDVEAKFDVRVDDSKLTDLKNVGDIVNLVFGMVSAQK